MNPETTIAIYGSHDTSFNIKGQPILTKISDAFYILDNTELDYIVYDNR